MPTNVEGTNDEVPQIGKVKEKRVESTGLREWALESMDFDRSVMGHTPG